MITNDGKELIGKYLIGQAPAYATHISIGCGAIPLDQNDTPPSASTIQAKSVMDFETYRVPIISRGFVDDGGITKMTFSAELPTENRYDITEVGLWSAGSNNLASGQDSHMIFNFSEAWEMHDTSVANIPFYDVIGSAGDITITDRVFSASTSNTILRNETRTLRKEGPRYLNQKIFLRGDSATITGSSGAWSIGNGSTHIHLNGTNLGIASNSPSDVLKLAFSLVDKTALAVAGNPDSVKIFIEFYKNEVTTTTAFAKAEITVNGADFTGNRYKVISIPISSLITSEGFSANEIRVCRISTSVIKGGTPSADYYICLDALRIDNVTTVNPLYKMVGYSIVKDDGKPIIKYQNTNNYIEFRVALGIT